MSDNVATSSAPPASPSYEFPPVDGTGPSQPASQGSLFEKLRNATVGVFTARGVPFKKGPGRPRNDGRPGKADVAMVSPPTNVPAAAAAVPTDDIARLYADLVKSCAASTSKGIFSVADGALKRLAIRKGYDRATASELIAGATPTDKEHESIAEVTLILLQKYGVDIKNIPEVLGILTLASIATRYGAAFLELSAFENAKPAKGATT